MKGPRGEKRPADVIGNAIMVAKLATGELTEDHKEPTNRKNSGKARAKALSAEKRSEIAKKAAKKRWGKSPSIEPFKPYVLQYL